MREAIWVAEWTARKLRLLSRMCWLAATFPSTPPRIRQRVEPITPADRSRQVNSRRELVAPVVRALSTASICRPQEQLAGLVALQQYGEIGSRRNRHRLRKHHRLQPRLAVPSPYHRSPAALQRGPGKAGCRQPRPLLVASCHSMSCKPHASWPRPGMSELFRPGWRKMVIPRMKIGAGTLSAAVVKSSGGEPPKNPAWADNWAGWGVHSDVPVPGGVAVRRFHIHGHGHVTTTTGEVDPKTGTFGTIGGNQGEFEQQMRSRDYEFRAPPPPPEGSTQVAGPGAGTPTTTPRGLTSWPSGSERSDLSGSAAAAAQIGARGGAVARHHRARTPRARPRLAPGSEAQRGEDAGLQARLAQADREHAAIQAHVDKKPIRSTRITPNSAPTVRPSAAALSGRASEPRLGARRMKPSSTRIRVSQWSIRRVRSSGYDRCGGAVRGDGASGGSLLRRMASMLSGI